MPCCPPVRRFGMGHSSRGKMKMPFGWERCMKYTLCSLNLIIMLGGLTVIAVGVWTVVDKLSLESLLGTNLYMSAAWILIGTGIGVIAIAFFGCFGAIRAMRCMLLTYFVILFCIFILLLLGGILGYVFRDEVEESMRQQMHDTMIRDYGFTKVVNDAWDVLQQTLHCCAVDAEYNLTNWIHSRWYEKQDSPRPLLPESCCRVSDDVDAKGYSNYTDLSACQGRFASKYDKWPNPAFVYMEPCLAQAKEGVQDHAVILGAIAIAIACSLISGMIFSLCLFREIDHQ